MNTPPAPRVPRFLFVSPHLPYAKASVDDDNIDYFYYRNTLDQGLFQLRQLHSWHPLHFLAQNLPVDAVVLENPTWKDFTREIDRGAYDVVAISFTVVLTGKVLEMVTWLRTRHPHLEIILGGYGTAIFDEHFGIEQEIASRVDHICRGEGLSFLRDYLARRWGVRGESPLRQDLVPTTNGVFRSRVSIYDQLAFVSELGCRNGCVFCATSSHFARCKIPIAVGEGLYQVIREQAGRHPRARSAIVYSENFLDDREQVLTFMRCMEQDRELAQRPLLLTIFSSVRSIAQYSVSELVRCGVGTIFVGVESFRREILDGESLDKRQGNVAELFEKLHRAGINTLGSMVVGWDGHTPENIGAELDAFVGLNPTFYQIVPLHPVPGTPLWQRIRREGRLIDGYRYQDDGAARSNFAFKHFDMAQVDGLVRSTYRRLVDEGGPWPFRLCHNLWQGARDLAHSDDEALRRRARALERMVRSVLPMALASGLLFRGSGFQRRWRSFVAELWRARPWLVVAMSLLACVQIPALSLLSLAGRLRFALLRHGDQPATVRRRFQNADGALLADEATAPIPKLQESANVPR
ncbi:MAG: B12-binding domain-containing radical SAM protein [Pseudomonadota bacterium]